MSKDVFLKARITLAKREKLKRVLELYNRKNPNNPKTLTDLMMASPNDFLDKYSYLLEEEVTFEI